MLRKTTAVAAFIGALSLAAVPLMTSAANAQGDATQPPKAPSPSEAGAGGGGMAKGGAMKGKGAMMKKKPHMKKKM